MGGYLFLWTAFLVCTGLIVFAGSRLSRYGDIIAEKSGLGRAWIGLVLMATVTSLPELITGISSVTVVGVPNIAVGDVLGSCVFNMLILSVLDALYRQGPISAKAHHGNILSGGIGILLLGGVAMSIITGEKVPHIGWIGTYTVLFVITYLFAMKLIYTYEKRQIAQYIKDVAEEPQYQDISMRTALINYALNSFIVILAASFLPSIGEGIAEQSGLGQTFVGNIFIAFSTSLPEVVVSIAAVRIDAIDLAIGNLFGSNIFNIFILAIDDLLYMQGPILAFTETAHVISALSAIIMTAIAIIGMTYRAEKKQLFLAWDSVGIVIIYLINLMFLYMVR